MFEKSRKLTSRFSSSRLAGAISFGIANVILMKGIFLFPCKVKQTTSKIQQIKMKPSNKDKNFAHTCCVCA